MKKLKEFVKANYKDIICVGITLICALFAFAFPYFLPRLGESLRDLGTSLAYWFCELFEIRHDVGPTVVNPSATPLTLPGFPKDYSEFSLRWKEYWQLFVTSANVTSYMRGITDMLLKLSKFLVLILPLVIALKLGFDRYMSNENNDYNKDSAALIAFKKFEYRVYLPVKEWLREFFGFVRERKYYWITWLVLWAVYFNLASIVIEFFAFYFFFAAEFDFLALFVQMYKLACDLSVPIEFVPGIIWLIAGYVVFHLVRKAIGYIVLNHLEKMNRGFINAQPIVWMTCGTMGKQKTTTITDMALSQSVMFRDKAFELILKNDLKFPNFPWINLENAIKKAMANHSIYNLATCKRFIDHKKRKFKRRPCAFRIFMYDYKRYGVSYNDDLQVVDIWEVLENYTKLYFIYVMKSCLIISNYSIREDSVLEDLGNFPLWHSDFFKTDSRLIDSYSRHSKILDYDSLRLGNKLLEDNQYADFFEFGIVVMTEIGKERGNTLELRDKKKTDDETNQKNDLFDDWLKMVRHSATVDNFPFVRVIVDEQRPSSWGANARDLCHILHISEVGENRLAMPFFTFGNLLHNWSYDKFSRTYYSYRFNRADNTLFMYLYKNITAAFHGLCTRITNRFGFHQLLIDVEKGTQDGMVSQSKYFIMNKKIYSKRFSTDCYSDFFVQKALRSPVGLGDLPEYVTDTATLDELRQQNSYFINGLLNYFDIKFLR